VIAGPFLDGFGAVRTPTVTLGRTKGGWSKGGTEGNLCFLCFRLHLRLRSSYRISTEYKYGYFGTQTHSILTRICRLGLIRPTRIYPAAQTLVARLSWMEIYCLLRTWKPVRCIRI
jgi:hypothetical protein